MLTLLGASMAKAGDSDTALKLVFQQSRAEKNIDLVLPVFLKTRFYVIVHGTDKPNDFYLVPSPDKKQMCVTVSESLDSLRKVNWPKVEITGEQLIKSIPPEIEIVIAYKDGGDYLGREQLQWYRGNMH